MYCVNKILIINNNKRESDWKPDSLQKYQCMFGVRSD